MQFLFNFFKINHRISKTSVLLVALEKTLNVTLKKGSLFLLTQIVLSFSFNPSYSQDLEFTSVHGEVDFSRKLRDWDGFGFNYVETAQTVNYVEDPQEYGGFSLLKESDKQAIVDLVFGEDGLKVGLVKMFLDPHHQYEPDGKFDHEKSTKNMRYFVREGLRKTEQNGRQLKIITTLYGPPPFITQQKFMRGRDLDPAMKSALVNYMVDWVKFLKDKEKLPIKYISLHNEGEDWHRWPADGKSGNIGKGHDYNLFWSPTQVTEFISLVRKGLDKAGLTNIGVTPGENTNWYRFSQWGYANAIASEPAALRDLDLITSHGFYAGNYGKWFGEHTSVGTDMIREKKKDIHAWVTSTSWSKMDAFNIKEMHGNIYTAKVNGIIPWAGIQRPTKWVGGDPNPGSAFTVKEDGTYEVRRGYYFYKQVSRAGQAGMGVAYTSSMDSELCIIGFSKNGTKNNDAVVITNMAKTEKKLSLLIKGSGSKVFEGFRTNESETEKYTAIEDAKIENGYLIYTAPAGTVTTFFAK